MAVETVKLEFDSNYQGQMEVKNGVIPIGKEAFLPYNLLFGALGSCLYYTFMDIVIKKRLTFEKVNLEISGVKRQTVPTTLEEVNIKFIIKGASDQKQFEKSVKLAEEYCSIHATIAKVAKINVELSFE